MDSQSIIKFISSAKKKTPAKIFIKGELNKIDFGELEYYGNDHSGIIFCELEEFHSLQAKHGSLIHRHRIEIDRRNSAVPLADLSNLNCRIEPGAVIREHSEIGNNCVIMMGALINIGAVIGENTMIDMNAVIGGRAIIGKNCHIGAGAVLAGVIEPPSAKPVIVEDNVLIGANAVILEGIKIGKGAVVAAGSVVVKDVEENSVVAGVPARFLKTVTSETERKTQLVLELRSL